MFHKFKKIILISAIIITSFLFSSVINATDGGIIDWLYSRTKNLIYGNQNVTSWVLGGQGTSSAVRLQIYGGLEVDTLSATSTTKFNGITYTWPAADGSNSQQLTTNGAGTLSWTASGGGISLLDDLTDVVLTATSTGDVLQIDGINWVNKSFANIFDVRLTATTTLPKLTTLAGLSSIGTITTGIWNSTAIGTQYGGTGQNWSAVGSGSLPYFNAIGGMTTLAGGSANNVLTYSGTAPQWSSALNVSSIETGTLYVSGSVNQGNFLVSPGNILTGTTATTTIKGDNATSTFSNKISSITGDFFVSSAGITNNLLLNPWASTGKVGIGTTSPSYAFSVNGKGYLTDNIISDGIFTSQNTGTSTFGGGSFSLLSVTGNTATSTFANGINLTAGCFSVSGTCVGGGGSGTINSGTTNRLAYYSGATTLDSANYLGLDVANEKLGVGTTSPFALLSVNAPAGQNSFVVGSSTKTSFIIDQNGRVGIGTLALTDLLNVYGDGNYINNTFPSATSYAGLQFYEGSNSRGYIQAIGSNFATVNRRNNIELASVSGGIHMQKDGGEVWVGTGDNGTIQFQVSGSFAGGYSGFFYNTGGTNVSSGIDVLGGDNTSGTLINFGRSDGTTIGDITFASGGTVSYNAFTGSHYGFINEETEDGMLVSMTGENYLENGYDLEPIYIVKQTTKANDSQVLGSYLGRTIREEKFSISNPDLIASVGNGKMWVIDNGEDIEAGDALISSDTKGHAQKDKGEYAVSYVVARASENVDWDEETKMIDGMKHKKITVLYESWVQKNFKDLFINEDGTLRVKKIVAEEVETKKLCLNGDDGEKVCVTKDRLKKLLNDNE